jgi:hypothetical protein
LDKNNAPTKQANHPGVKSKKGNFGRPEITKSSSVQEQMDAVGKRVGDVANGAVLEK